MSSRVLLVEDDDEIRATTRLVLEDEGFAVAEASSGEEGMEAFAALAADCVVLDVMLPGISGFEVCRRIRAVSGVPIIMLTARTDSHDVVAGLEAGADDYVTKPYHGKELAARVRALLRRARGQESPGSAVRVADLEIRPEEGVVLKAGSPVQLTRTEFRLLCVMAERPGIVFSREALLEQVWGYDYFGETKLVDTHVFRLRGKIEDDASVPAVLLTARGLGYKVAG